MERPLLTTGAVLKGKAMKPKRKKKAPAVHVWTQRAPAEVIAGALHRAKTDPDAINRKLWKLTKLVNFLLEQYGNGGKA
jgi:hypothetical protein